MTWNYDISEAPRGHTEKVMRATAKGKEFEVDQFNPDPVILTANCGTVMQSYWIEKSARWHGLSTNEIPVAWMPWPSPAAAREIADL